MKLITATMQVTTDVLASESFDVKEYLRREVLLRLRKQYEEVTGTEVGNALWDILAGCVVETSTILFEAGVWQIKAQMMVPEKNELFKEVS